MNYIPTNAVWEITYACNMRCKHCGSSCGEKYPDELTLEEALKLCDDLADLGMKYVTLSGGEPFLHPYWSDIATRMTEHGITVNAISNGWFIDEALVKKAHASGIGNIGVSLDGLRDTHDFIRRPGAFDHVLSALDMMNKHKMPTVICTSINKQNFSELAEMKELLYKKKVDRWQFQIASPMGNLLEHRELLCDMEDADKLIDFCYDVMKEEKITIDLADDLGYFNIKENELRKKSFNINKPFTVWQGCQAGKCVMGIRANGDISGCLSIRDDNFIEGNIKYKKLKDIWTDKRAFSWNRDLTKEKLTGFCGKCQYGNYCLGGCTGLKLTFSGSIYENKYCSFRLAIEKEEQRIKKITDIQELIKQGRQSLEDEEFQIAELYLERAKQLDPENLEVLNLLGFVNYSLENLEKAKAYNVEVLKLDQQNAYAHKGLGICLSELGDIEEAIGHLNKAIQYADETFTDPYFDLALILADDERPQEAIEVLEKARKISPEFIKISQDLYDSLKEEILIIDKKM